MNTRRREVGQYSRILAFATSLLLAACSPQQQIYRSFDAHENITLRDDTLLAADETVLPVRSWLPEGKPKAVVIALHGFNDYSNAFAGTGEYFSRRGIALFAYDQRGFGMTGYTGYWANEKNLVSDLAQCVMQARHRYPGVKLYVLGESMGGAVALDALAEPDFPAVDGVMLSAPAVWGAETMNAFFRSTLWLGAHTLPGDEITGSSLKIMASNNIPMLRRLSADPLVIKKTRIDAVYGLVTLMDSAYAAVPDVRVPVLLLYGGHDQVIPRRPVKQALSRFTAPVTFAYYPEGYHMLMRDMQGQLVMADMLSWILQPEAALPSGFEREQRAEFPAE